MAVRSVPSTCTECLVQCGSLIQLDQAGEVVRITGNPAHPGSRGAFCVKGVHGPVANRNNPNRILHPLRRVGERGADQWEPIGWDEALEAIADRLVEIKQRHGGESIAGASATFTQSRGTAVRLLLRSLGSPNFMINQDMCHGGRSTAAFLTGFGGTPGTEIRKSRVIMVVGKSPSDSDIVEWTHIQAARAQGAMLIVIDPRRTSVSQRADHWLRPEVGSDAALALAMIDVVIREQLFDREFVEQWCEGFEELSERAAEYPPEVAAPITGIPAEVISATARAFATAKPGCMILGHGIDAQEHGVYTAMAFQALLALTGNIDRAGSNRAAKAPPGYRGGYAFFANSPDFRPPADVETKILGGETFPLWCGPGTYSQTTHNPAVIDAMLTGKPYPVRALYICGTNLLSTYPDQLRTRTALDALDLLIVATDVMTPTAARADFVLPKTTLLEEEEILVNQGEPAVTITQRIYPPRGEARADIDIIAGLIAALRRRGAIDHELFPWSDGEQYNAYVLEKSGITLDALRTKGFIPFEFGYEDYRKGGFKTPSGKFEFASERLGRIGVDQLPRHKASPFTRDASQTGLVLLTGIRTMAYHHSRYRNHAWARKVKDAPELMIHPATATSRNIADGDWVWVKTTEKDRRALLKARLTDSLPEHIVATGMGWWYPELTGDDGAVFNIGSAMAYGPEFDPISGSPARSRNTLCTVAPADMGEVAPLLARTATPG